MRPRPHTELSVERARRYLRIHRALCVGVALLPLALVAWRGWLAADADACRKRMLQPPAALAAALLDEGVPEIAELELTVLHESAHGPRLPAQVALVATRSSTWLVTPQSAVLVADNCERGARP